MFRSVWERTQRRNKEIEGKVILNLEETELMVVGGEQ